MHFTTVYSV